MRRHGETFHTLLPSERRQSEKATCCVIPPTGHSGKGKTVETVRGSVVARGWGKEGMNRQSTKGLPDSETTLYDIIMVDTCHNTFI